MDRASEAMTEVPKIVHQRLRAAGEAAATPHPESDVLAAFAEQALTQSEREDVLAHLALCQDCREVLRLAVPPSEMMAAPVEREAELAPVTAPRAERRNRNWFAWGGLRWAGLAAGMAMALLVVRMGLEHHPVKQVSVGSVTSQESPANRTAETVKSGENSTPGNATELTPPQAAASQMTSGVVSAENPSAQSAKNTERLASNRLAVIHKPRAPSPIPRAKASGDAFETAEVSAGSGAGIGSGAGNLMARAEAPAIEKAKPPFENAEDLNAAQKPATSASGPVIAPGRNGMLVANSRAAAFSSPNTVPLKVRFMINAGVLRRSVDDGASWQTSLRTDHPLFYSANRGPEVWAGGQAGTLLHSTDTGTTWNVVQASSQGEQLTSDITHIEMPDSAHVVLTTAAQETWSSADSGKSWQKQ